MSDRDDTSDGSREERKPSEMQVLLDLVCRQMEASQRREDRVIALLEQMSVGSQPPSHRSARRSRPRRGPGRAGAAHPGAAVTLNPPVGSAAVGSAALGSACCVHSQLENLGDEEYGRG